MVNCQCPNKQHTPAKPEDDFRCSIEVEEGNYCKYCSLGCLTRI